jgi:hypothetical protein
VLALERVCHEGPQVWRGTLLGTALGRWVFTTARSQSE